MGRSYSRSNHASKLTRYQVIEARERAASGEPIKQIAADLGAEYPYLWNAVRGKTFAWLSDPPPVPAGSPVPIQLYTCENPYCDERFPPGHGRICRACQSYYYRNGRHRKPEAIRRGPYIEIPEGRIRAAHRCYLSGEPLAKLSAELSCSDETLRRRFTEYGLQTFSTPAGHNQKLTAALVRQARRLVYEDGRPINEVAEELGINYQTLYDAVVGLTWRAAGGPMPESEEEMRECARCGLLSRQRLCRFCRSERVSLSQEIAS